MTKTPTLRLLLALALFFVPLAIAASDGADSATVTEEATALDVTVFDITVFDITVLAAGGAPACSLTDTGEPLDLLPSVLASKDGCSNSSCDASCRAQGYDYGVCFATICECRFWYP